jgi:hypothetical protein
LYGQEGLVSAVIDCDSLVGARYDLDVAGHYAPGRVPPGSGRTAPAPGGLPRLTAWPHWLSVRP